MKKIIVSACLMGENCKYDGGNNYSEKLAMWLAERLAEGELVSCIPVCPEMLGGLDAPRKPCEIVNGVVQTEDGTSCDEEFRHGAELAWQLACDAGVDMEFDENEAGEDDAADVTVRKEKPKLAILQSRSPSCGVGRIYDGTFSGNKTDGNGVFAQFLIDQGVKVIDIAEL